MNHKCLRCGGELKDVTPSDIEDIRFFSCNICPCSYTENEEGRLHDRWLMPITLPLYGVIFEGDPLNCVDEAVNEMVSREKEFRDILVKHITEELESPKQRITDIHKFKFPDEVKLREFLRLIKLGIESKKAVP